MVAIDGTKMSANASQERNHSYVSGIAREILREAEGTDRRRMSSTAMRGAMSCRSSCGPRRRARQALRRQAADRGAQGPLSRGRRSPTRDVEVDPELVLGRGGRRGGRREWPRVARRELEARREREAEPIPRDREDRLFQALGRLEENHRVDLAANQAYERWRSSSRDTLGRVMKGNRSHMRRRRCRTGRSICPIRTRG